jgi:hypothetical protein
MHAHSQEKPNTQYVPPLLYTLDEMLAMRPIEWLVEGIIPVGGFAVLYGPPGTGKTFIALDLALHVAAGQRWLGHDVKAGNAVYISAEGRAGMPTRLAGLIQHNPALRADANWFLPEPIQLLDPDAARGLLTRFDAYNLKPTLVVVDTLARCFVGGDENSSRDVGLLIATIGEIQRQTGAAVILLHHSGKPNEANNRRPSERGSSALRGAADTMIRIQRNKGVVELINDKQKDGAEFTPITITLKQTVVGDKVDEHGSPVTTCVVVATDAKDVQDSPDSQPSVGAQRALDVLAAFPTQAASSADWRSAIEKQNGKPIPPRTFQNRRGELVKRGLVEPCPHDLALYRVVGQSATSANGTPSAASSGAPSSAASATPLLGVAQGIGVRVAEGVEPDTDKAA